MPDKLTELDAIAFLLAAPSQLNRSCTDCPQADLAATAERELLELEVSDGARKNAVDLLKQLTDDERKMLRVTANKLQTMFWPFEDPHPDQPMAKSLVAKMRDGAPA